ncbi:MAG: hypothetical protein ACFCVD_03850 [Nodosilinea sp.]
MAEPVQAVTHPRSDYIHGNVSIAPGVAMAEGVILAAAEGCRLVISTGVCLGTKVMIQARGGDLIVEPGANLGHGVLVVGHGLIGLHVCIGADSTVINPDLGASQVVPPRALVGDPSHANGLSVASPLNSAASPAANGPNGFKPGDQGVANSPLGPAAEIAAPAPDSSNGSPGDSALAANGAALNGQAPQPAISTANTATSDAQTTDNSRESAQNGTYIYGKKQVNHLLETLFPHRRALNGTSPEGNP